MSAPPPPYAAQQQPNGEQQPHSYARTDPNGDATSTPPALAVAPADTVLTLVSNCVVNQRAFANTCGVPLGAHMDFLPNSMLRLPHTARPPVRCNGCSGFLNVYCKTNLLKWVWKCNMCGCVNINKEQLGHSADIASYPELCSEAVEYVLPLPEGHPVAAQQHSSHLVFAIDTTMDAPDLQAAKEALLATLSGGSLPPSTLISLVTFDGCVAVHDLGAQRCSHVLPAATTGPTTAPAPTPASGPSAASPTLELQAAVQQLLDRHCAGTAAARAGAAAAAGAGGGVGAGVSSGMGLLVSELQACAPRLPKVLATLRTVQADVPLRERARCLCSAVEASLSLISAHAGLDLSHQRHLNSSRVVVLAGGPATRGPGAVPLELLDQAVTEKGRSPENRAVAAALDVGVAVGSAAAKLGVAIDVFTSTSTGINAPLLTAIAHGSGGELMPQLAFPLRHQPRDHHAQPHQPDTAEPLHGAAAGEEGPAGGFVGHVLARQLAAALTRRFGLEGRLDCYCSEGLRLLQWLGPLEAVREDLEHGASPSSGAAGVAAGAAVSAATKGAAPISRPAAPTPAPTPHSRSPLWLSSAACSVTALEVGRGAALRLEVTRDLDVPSLLLQVALHYVDCATRERIVRVVTRKLQVVESRGEFLRAVSPTAAAALLGKRAVLEAKKTGAFRDCRRAEEARYGVAAALGLVAARCGVEVQVGRGMLGFGTRKLRQWPPELMPLAYALYHFQRGPILGPPTAPPPGTHPPSAHAHLHALWDADARLVGMNSLLWSAWGSAYRAMSPKLYAVLPPPRPQSPRAVSDAAATAAASPQQQLAALPCVTLAAVMARTAPLILDVGSAVLVSNTEEPPAGGYGRSGGSAAAADGGAGALTASLLDAAFQVVSLGVFDVDASGRRFPLPAVVLTPGAQAGGGALAARLIPVHRDGYDEQALQHPQLQQLGQAVAAQLSKQLLEGATAAAAAAAAETAAAGLPAAQVKQAAAAAASFVEWCRGVNVQPFPVR